METVVEQNRLSISVKPKPGSGLQMLYNGKHGIQKERESVGKRKPKIPRHRIRLTNTPIQRAQSLFLRKDSSNGSPQSMPSIQTYVRHTDCGNLPWRSLSTSWTSISSSFCSLVLLSLSLLTAHWGPPLLPEPSSLRRVFAL